MPVGVGCEHGLNRAVAVHELVARARERGFGDGLGVSVGALLDHLQAAVQVDDEVSDILRAEGGGVVGVHRGARAVDDDPVASVARARARERVVPWHGRAVQGA